MIKDYRINVTIPFFYLLSNNQFIVQLLLKLLKIHRNSFNSSTEKGTSMSAVLHVSMHSKSHNVYYFFFISCQQLISNLFSNKMKKKKLLKLLSYFPTRKFINVISFICDFATVVGPAKAISLIRKVYVGCFWLSVRLLSSHSTQRLFFQSKWKTLLYGKNQARKSNRRNKSIFLSLKSLYCNSNLKYH